MKFLLGEGLYPAETCEFIAFCPLQWQRLLWIPATAMKLLRFEKKVLTLLCKDHHRFEFLHNSKQFSELERDA